MAFAYFLFFRLKAVEYDLPVLAHEQRFVVNFKLTEWNSLKFSVAPQLAAAKIETKVTYYQLEFRK